MRVRGCSNKHRAPATTTEHQQILPVPQITNTHANANANADHTPLTSVAKYLPNMDLALDHIDISAGAWPDLNAFSLVSAALGAMQIRPSEVLTSADMLTKLMDIHADAQAPRDSTSTIASRKGGGGGGGLSAEAKVGERQRQPKYQSTQRTSPRLQRYLPPITTPLSPLSPPPPPTTRRPRRPLLTLTRSARAAACSRTPSRRPYTRAPIRLIRPRSRRSPPARPLIRLAAWRP